MVHHGILQKDGGWQKCFLHCLPPVSHQAATYRLLIPLPLSSLTLMLILTTGTQGCVCGVCARVRARVVYRGEQLLFVIWP